jgi:hypothetical protein
LEGITHRVQHLLSVGSAFDGLTGICVGRHAQTGWNFVRGHVKSGEGSHSRSRHDFFAPVLRYQVVLTAE